MEMSTKHHILNYFQQALLYCQVQIILVTELSEILTSSSARCSGTRTSLLTSREVFCLYILFSWGGAHAEVKKKWVTGEWVEKVACCGISMLPGLHFDYEYTARQ